MAIGILIHIEDRVLMLHNLELLQIELLHKRAICMTR